MKKRIINKKGDSAEILIYDDIGGGWFGGLSAKEFAEQLKAVGDVSTINVRIASDGGEVFQGMAIYNTLKRNKARVVVDIDGVAASTASFIAMAGDEINIAANGTLMIHDPWGMATGTSDEFRQQADLLDQVRDQILDTYTWKAGPDQRIKISEMMRAETWMNAVEALDANLVDNITGEMQVAAKYHPDRFKHPPAALLKAQTVVKQQSTGDRNSARAAYDHMAVRVGQVNK